MATFGTVAFLSALAIKGLVIDFLFCPQESSADLEDVSPRAEVGSVEIPNELLILFYDQPLPDDVKGRNHPVTLTLTLTPPRLC